MINKFRVIAFYLPQFHPIPENDEWWGKGFTEWTCVAQSKRLYPGHYQPHVPADLGFYDLRVPEVREQQAQMAMEYGVEGFCYWHYWFAGKELLERPLKEVLESGKPDYPFCIGWGNHTWEKKLWDKHGNSKVLIEQTYPGEEDDTAHFYSLLPAFKDPRYIKVNGKCFFVIHNTFNLPAIANFVKTWRRLANENGLEGFYFASQDFESRRKDEILAAGVDAVYNSDILNIHHHLNVVQKGLLMIMRDWFHLPTVFSYKKAMRYMLNDDCKKRGVMPVIAPNWDHSPRTGGKALILHNSKPKYFYELAKKAFWLIKDKPAEERIVMLKSWNEWGEGNHLEPDLKYGKQYLEALKKALEEA